MPAADTNVLVRLVADDDEQQQRHVSSFLRRSGPVFVSHVVLTETCWVLVRAYALSRADLARSVEMFLSTDVLRVERPEIVAEALRSFRSSAADFSDCLILASARAANELPLATFEDRLGRLEGAIRLGGKRPARSRK